MPSKYLFLATLVAVLVAFLAAAAFRAWRTKSNQQLAGFSAPESELTQTQISRFGKVQYVSTVITDEPLNRISAHGLGFRGWASLSVSREGLVVERKGERNLAIPNRCVVGVQLDSATIDRAVEQDGLIRVDWNHDSTALSTFLRANTGAQKLEIFEALEAMKEAAK